MAICCWVFEVALPFTEVRAAGATAALLLLLFRAFRLGRYFVVEEFGVQKCKSD